ncbi:MFS transporter [Nocardioides jiangxiensis]|uniref:MFS transporter n=1 Tax=Nocardioides jiangxiensis TaxID=3064524 RepID=A0ABT9B4R8_9ACTN|nr:MFS transporter [Nocardioides sp. WY-20]MDO7868143.1 MFS transporter [Nocardioides sp. WY-20]
MNATTATGRAWTPWRTVFAFGLVSLAADMVYEGMRAMAGPLLGDLGASALTVGLVTGAGEGIALILRLLTGAWADQAQNHWRLTVLGYAMTAVCVPLLAVTPFLGAAGLVTAAVLILLERTGKAVRSPAKSALLARMATQTGRGKGFGVHKAMDQVGAFSGPLLLSGMAALTGVLWPGFAVLAVPGALSLVLLAQLRRHAPIVEEEDDGASPRRGVLAGLRTAVGTELPGAFHVFSLATAFMTAGLMTFGVISFRLVDHGIVTAAVVPLVYAGAMAVEAVAALVTGQLFDRWGGGVLLLVPVLVAGVPLLVFADTAWVVLVGVAVWGVATAIQDSTVKAYVADLVPTSRRATAYGVFAAVQGLGALGGGALAGALVQHHLPVLAAIVAGLQVVAAVLVGWTLLRARRTEQ